MKQIIEYFEELEITKIEYENNYWIPAIDVAKALGFQNPSRQVSEMLNNNKEIFEGYFVKLTSKISSSAQRREYIFLNLKGVLAFLLKTNSKKAIPFQKWAIEKLEKHINEIPEDIKLIARKKRVEFTDTLKKYGYTKPHEYIQTTKQMKENLGIDKNKKKENCDLIEVMKIATSEMLAKTKIILNNPNGYKEVNPICQESSKIIKENTEKKLTVTNISDI